MKKSSASKSFFLAWFSLFSSAQCQSPSSSHASPDVCALNPKAKVSDACASYADLDALNTKLHPYVRNLANNTDFFSYYRLNLYNKKCPFWSDENGLCGNIACAVTTLEHEEDIPAIWRAEELSKLEGPKAQHPGRKQQRERQRPLLGELGEGVGESCVVEYDDECDERDYCVPEDESASAKGDYVSLAENPERFTGYAGEGAHQVWEAIYRENCFSRPSPPSEKSQAAGGLQAPLPGFSQNQAQAAMDFRQVMKAHDRQQARKSGVIEEALEPEDECLEKRVFYRVISGMHAAISTHLCADYLNQTTGQWGPNLQCYKERLHSHPERISNLYFNYAFVLRAVGKLRDYVHDYTFCTGDPAQDGKTKQMIRTLASAIPSGPKIFDERVMFQDHTEDGISLKEDFRNRFRNVSRIMDCVGCDKCRLWGKVQTNGFGTALKVLFEFGNADEGVERPLLRRTELVALINTLDKISSALKAVEDFRAMMEAELEGKDPHATLEASKASAAAAATDPSRLINDTDDFPDFSDLDGLEEEDADTSTPPPQRPSISDQFWHEFEIVFRTFRWVLRSWAQLPKKLAAVLGLEMNRLWDFWLGKPVRERMWRLWRAPGREEL
ncbi:endoplasmic oxidoreductin-1 [Saxophila tyrrhenica]|uniref:Endoplasmic oxidoreductin-1 n=1 Tax=Saxophila tyrrhenica TaxID=1690608 RepID=A0AAV9PIH7_9PEZI|nr:endoplasmic oxidoreductin-1 [Saxophila tyrrhenica]